MRAEIGFNGADRPMDPGIALALLLMMGALSSTMLLISAALDEVGIAALTRPDGIADAATADILLIGTMLLGFVVVICSAFSESLTAAAMNCRAAPAAAALAKKLLGPTSPLPFAPLFASTSLLCLVTLRKNGEGRSSSFDRS